MSRTSLPTGAARALRVRQVEPSATVQVVAPADVQILGVTFTPDGSRLTYVAYREGAAPATLYEVPVLGGTPRRLMDDVDREVAFAPDAARFAFVRGIPKPAAPSCWSRTRTGPASGRSPERRTASEFVLANRRPGRRTAASSRPRPTTTDRQRRARRGGRGTGSGPARRTGRWNSVGDSLAPRRRRRCSLRRGTPAIADQDQLWEVTVSRRRRYGESRRTLAGYSGVSLDRRRPHARRHALGVARHPLGRSSRAARPHRPGRLGAEHGLALDPIGGQRTAGSFTPRAWPATATSGRHGPTAADLRQLTTSPARRLRDRRRRTTVHRLRVRPRWPRAASGAWTRTAAGRRR